MSGAGLARSRRSLSAIRQDGPLRTFGLNAGPLAFVPTQPAGWAHLVTVHSGAATLRVPGALTLVTPGVATWVPAGMRYGVELHGVTALRIAYVADAAAPRRAFGTVVVSRLLAEILERSVIRGYLDPGTPEDARIVAVAFDELRALESAHAATALALPRDAGLLRAVDVALRVPEKRPRTALLAAAAGLSARSFERRFLRETGLSPRAWLRLTRLRAANVALARGETVTEAGFAAGYASTSAFVAAYRSTFGITPGRLRRYV